MALIIRMDIDRAYGHRSLIKKTISRISSDLYFPKLAQIGYLNDLLNIIEILNQKNVQAYVFFRKCTLPKLHQIEQILNGNHKIGWHLENSRSYETLIKELRYFKDYFNLPIETFSKHGSGQQRYGLFHYVPYEPAKYINWGKTAGMKMFLGNQEDPSIPDYYEDGLHVFPAAFWLEPYWRDTNKYNTDWLIENAQKRDIVLLFHPDNVTIDGYLIDELIKIIENVPVKVFD